MEHTKLGATGLEISRLGLGTMTFGREVDEAGSHRLLDRFVEAGGTFIDTADGYNDGRSEEILGSWLRAGARSRSGSSSGAASSPSDAGSGSGAGATFRAGAGAGGGAGARGPDRAPGRAPARQDLVIATKVRFGSGPNRRGLSRKHLLDAVDASLRRLGTDYIDLYQLHMWDYGTPVEETLRALDTIVRSGRVRYLGVSNVTGAQLQHGVDLCRAAGWEPLVSLQPLYNLLDREAEWELLPVCQSEGLGVLPYSPLRGGWLTGKFRRGATPAVAASRAGAAPTGAASRGNATPAAAGSRAAVIPAVEDSRRSAAVPAAEDSRGGATPDGAASADDGSRVRIRAGDGVPTRIAATDRPGEPTWTEAWANYAFDDRTWTVVDTLAAVAAEIGRTPAQTALNWLLHRPGVTAPIIGARTVEQLEDNLAALDFTLSPVHRDRLDRASDKPRPYPYQLLSDLRDV
jgi:aryl-alcohol dehydrogenase-like predicted oxidoreductase